MMVRASGCLSVVLLVLLGSWGAAAEPAEEPTWSFAGFAGCHMSVWVVDLDCWSDLQDPADETEFRFEVDEGVNGISVALEWESGFFYGPEKARVLLQYREECASPFCGDGGGFVWRTIDTVTLSQGGTGAFDDGNSDWSFAGVEGSELLRLWVIMGDGSAGLYVESQFEGVVTETWG